MSNNEIKPGDVVRFTCDRISARRELWAIHGEYAWVSPAIESRGPGSVRRLDDLVLVQDEPKPVCFINAYANGESGLPHPSREGADLTAHSARSSGRKRVAVIVTHDDGSVKVEPVDG